MKQQRSIVKKRNQPEKRQKGDAVGRASCRSSLLGDPGAQFFVETGYPNRTNEKLTKLCEHLSQVVDTHRISKNCRWGRRGRCF
jgi:hypothetical protein